MVVIGIGTAGCKVAYSFGKGHKKIFIGPDKFPKTCKTVEDYENKCPSLKKELTFSAKECWVFVCGASKTSGATLRILEKIKNKKLNVVYMTPDNLLSTPTQTKQDKVAFNVLQQFARSGLINSVYLVSNTALVDIAGEGPISDVYRNANSTIANIIETIEYFKSQEPVLGSIAETKEVSRIKTFSIGVMEESEEKLLFPLDNITESGYMYSINEDELNQENDLLMSIKDRVAQDKENELHSSFAIFSSPHERSFFYSIKSTHFIQEKI
jgi:hypothetical protein